MLWYIFSGTLLLSLLGAAFIFYRQLADVRAGRVDCDDHLDLGALFQRKIDEWYLIFAYVFHRGARLIYLYFLLGMRQLLLIFRYLLSRVERKFARLIDSVHGRGVVMERGAVSNFLSQIKDHKETAIAKLKTEQ